ncbi:VWA domain-containing protein [Candidatus Woesearchaeota archaeon]|nr:VWA domain-containing protein [Candidatus Woesearchaeota archaeon]
MFPSVEKVEEWEKAEEQEGTGFDEGLTHSLIEGNKERIDQGQLLDTAASQGLNAFNPDMVFEQIVKDFKNAQSVYGEKMLRLITGEDVSAIRKNIKFPEYQRQLKAQMNKRVQALKEEKLIDKEGTITEHGTELASLVASMEELDELRAKGIGEKETKKIQQYGEKDSIRFWKRHDRYRDIALKQSMKLALRRHHKMLEEEDLRVFTRSGRGKIYVVYGLDASGSMKGKKIALCKKAGIALAFQAIEKRDQVGLLVFGSEIEEVVYPTSDFSLFVKSIAKVKAKKQTDIALTIEKAMELFPDENVTKHIILLTDAMPTVGDDPKQKTLELVEQAAALGISISLIGIGLEREAETFAKQMVEIGNGRLYIIRDLENIDRIVLEDYQNL